ncbi:hypothetical protein K474DRAFT_1686903 [Panus rudis PR-1116 ss-1]|nr:hypothetical protein K474DRAFT_1686903 [Panus rudis PR-1116 ss-1]
MHRFRKKSDAKRAQVPDAAFIPPPAQPAPTEPLPALPPVSDFRTSLILPDLTRRFSVLRNSAGVPIGIDDLKSKFAEQRARGAENQVTEEEEDMILEALGRFHSRATRSRNTSSSQGDESVGANDSFRISSANDEGGSRISASPSLVGSQSVRSANTATSSVLHVSSSGASLSSGKSQYSRRMSNNLFGSGKFRDYSYMRNQRTRTDSTRSSSLVPSASNASMSTVTSSRAANNSSMYSDNQSLRPVTPEGSAYSPVSSPPASPDRHAAGDGSRPDGNSAVNARLSKTLSPEHLRRASLALDQVIRELEEEGDDEIVMERSPINRVPAATSRTPLDPEPPASPIAPSPGDYEAGQSSSDEQTMADEAQRASPYPRSRTTSPTNGRLPGYIPGMPRPMTPHDSSLDADDQTPSATPRATSPRLPLVGNHSSPAIAQSLASNIYRSNSSSSTHRQTSSRPVSPGTPQATITPLFFNRSVNGRFTPTSSPEDRSRSGTTSPSPEPTSDSGYGRHGRRPTSPLSAPAFQPLASVPSNSSRPSTPSALGHIRNNSSVSVGVSSSAGEGQHHHRGGDGAETEQGTLSRSNTNTRSLRSPALPDSPWVDATHTPSTFTSVNASADASGGLVRPPSAMSGMELGSPIQISNRPLRSPTPTNTNTNTSSGAYSPTSSVSSNTTVMNGVASSGFSSSRRSSRQNGHSQQSSFSLGPLLSPIANSSRSSLESAGSSYHSWDEDHKKDRLFTLFSQLDTDTTEWHDITLPLHEKSVSSTSGSGSGTGSSPDEKLVEAERIVRRDIGLVKSDFFAIQERLVSVALTKAATPEGRQRASSIRRRRPSTSQSTYSNPAPDSRVASPAPQQPQQVQQPASPSPASRTPNSDHIAKVSALLDSVVDSIQAPQHTNLGTAKTGSEDVVKAPLSPTSPSPSQKHRALADALFGVPDRTRTKTPVETPITSSPSTAPVSPVIPLSSPMAESSEMFLSPDVTTPKMSSSGRELEPPSSPGPSSPHGHPQGHYDSASLAAEVQRRAEAATAALRKSPSNPKITDGNASTRKRISPNQISSPKLVSASTSVDTIPLRSPSVASGHAQAQQQQQQQQLLQPHAGSSNSKFGSRFKRLRGTLRSKAPVPTGEEVTPYPLSLKPPPPGQTITVAPSNPHVEPAIMSANESTRFLTSPPVLPSPPASAGPGLKGFMSIFRRQRTNELQANLDRKHDTFSASTLSSSSSPSASGSAAVPMSPLSPQIQSAPATKTQYRAMSPRPTTPQAFVASPTIPEDSVPPSSPGQEAALQQLFDAANALDLDQAALSALLSRSPSLSSQATTLEKLKRKESVSTKRRSAQQAPPQSPLPEGRPSFDAASPRPSTDTRSYSRQSQNALASGLKPEPDVPTSAVVRRTLYLPDPKAGSALDLTSLLRKQSVSNKRRSAGAGSVQSNKSIRDRAPTPPPPKSNSGKRFSASSASAASSPPVPQLPHSFNVPEIQLPPAVDSLFCYRYDFYGNESRGASSVNPDAGPAPPATQLQNGQGLEIIELANGETIWSIVNGLRDNDAESFYGDRASFTSEYSLRDNDGVQVFFKEHGRKSSKGSNISFMSKKKLSRQGPRPETQVYHVPPSDIGQLIENISRGMDSGSFNIAPGASQRPFAHSATSSIGSSADARWTMEERTEQLIRSMNPRT